MGQETWEQIHSAKYSSETTVPCVLSIILEFCRVKQDTPTVLCYPSVFATCWLCDYNSCAICYTSMAAETRTNGAKPSQTHLSACRQSGGGWPRADLGAAWGNSWCPQNRNWCDGESAAVLHAACRTPTTWVFSATVDDCTDPVPL